MESPYSEDRRSFLVKVVAALQGIVALSLALPGVGYLLTPLLGSQAPADWVPLAGARPGKADPPLRIELTVRELDGYVVRGRKKAAWLVAEPDSGEPVVFSGECTHLGCNFDWSSADALFLCPCHGGRFDRTGRVVGGPPRRPLDRYPVKDDGGVLFVKPVSVPATRVASLGSRSIE